MWAKRNPLLGYPVRLLLALLGVLLTLLPPLMPLLVVGCILAWHRGQVRRPASSATKLERLHSLHRTLLPLRIALPDAMHTCRK